MFNKGFFCDKIGIMKNKVSFLAIIALAFGANYAYASECVGEDCEFDEVVEHTEMVIMDQEQPMIFEQNIGPMDFIDEEEPLTPIVNNINLNGYESCEYETFETSCNYDYNCPFNSASECAVWYKKPVHKTALLPRAPHLNDVRTDEILYAIYSDYDVTANDEAMSPLLERYKILMRASHACCGEGIIHKMRENGASDSEVYEFLKDDANYFAITERCMVMNDDEFQRSYSNGVTGKMAIEVRNACLCKNRQWFETLLQPFYDVYYRAPMFEDRPFVYNYIDGMQRDVTVYINDEVHTTMGLLGACPK